MRSGRRARRRRQRRPKVGLARDRRHPGPSPTDRETDDTSIGLPRSGDCESRLEPPLTPSAVSPKLRWQHPSGRTPACTSSADGSLAPIELRPPPATSGLTRRPFSWKRPSVRPRGNVNERLLRTQRTYDKVAGRYLENTRDRSELSLWLERFAQCVGAGATVLDLGAGPGCDSAELRRLGLRPISLDLSLGMLRAGVPEFPGPRVQADARRLPFRDTSVGGVWANACLLHLPPEEAAAALREVRRILCAPGLLHISVKSGNGVEWESERYGEPRWFQYWSGADLDALLTTAGFSVIASWSNSTPRADWLVRHAVPRLRAA